MAASKVVKSPLVNKKIRIVPIEKYATRVINNKSEATWLTGTERTECLPEKYGGGGWVDPLSPAEREFLEGSQGVNQNLSMVINFDDPTEFKKSYWTSKRAKLKFKKTGHNLDSAILTLDLSNPVDYIKYKIALKVPRIANSWAERDTNPEYEFAIKEDASEFIETASIIEKEDKVLEFLFKNKHNKKVLYDLCRLYGTEKFSATVGKDNNTEWLYTTLRGEAKNPRSIEDLSNLVELGQAEIATRILIHDGLEGGYIENLGGSFKIKDGTIIGFTKEEAAEQLAKPEYQELRLRIEDTAKK